MNRLFRLISLSAVTWLCVVSCSAASAASSNAGAASAGTVLITGSNRGIGFEFARQYAAAG